MSEMTSLSLMSGVTNVWEAGGSLESPLEKEKRVLLAFVLLYVGLKCS